MRCGDVVDCPFPVQLMGLDLCVFAVDDDAIVLRALERMLRSNNISVETFTSPAAFLERPSYDGIGCLLLDLKMPGLSGLDVQSAMGRQGISMPIVFLSAQSDVPSTARAMREGAIDFLEKPIDEAQLLAALERARLKAIAQREQHDRERDAEERLARLTKREREVCDLVAAGMLNKQIAYELGMSEKTVKVHRGRVTRKLDVDSVPALVRLLGAGLKRT
jgi:RNA polymerase sigma factor (sigma-70 family)